MLTACTQIVTVSLPERPVDESFQVFFSGWSEKERVTFAVKLFEDNGQTAICGAWSESPGLGPQFSALNDHMIGSSYITIDDEILVNDISFFAKGRFQDDKRPLGNANCRRTDRAWSKRFKNAAEIKRSRNRFTYEL